MVSTAKPPKQTAYFNYLHNWILYCHNGYITKYWTLLYPLSRLSLHESLFDFHQSKSLLWHLCLHAGGLSDLKSHTLSLLFQISLLQQTFICCVPWFLFLSCCSPFISFINNVLIIASDGSGIALFFQFLPSFIIICLLLPCCAPCLLLCILFWRPITARLQGLIRHKQAA